MDRSKSGAGRYRAGTFRGILIGVPISLAVWAMGGIVALVAFRW